MENKTSEKLKLSDLVDLKFLQEFQDTFAQSMGFASIAVDDDGPLTNPSCFTDFCFNCTRKTELGLKRCIECDIKWGKIAAEKQEPLIYDCHTGLTDFAVPIIVDGNHIASILGGQVLTKEPDEENFRKIARDLGINEEKYLEELRKIKIVPQEQVESAAKLLHLVANSISEIAHKNYTILEKNKKEAICQNIVETIRSSMDIDLVKKTIVEGVGKNLGAYKCFILSLDTSTNRFLPVDKNSIYLSSPDVKCNIGANPEDVSLSFVMQKLKKIREFVSINIEDFIEANQLEFSKINEVFEFSNIKTALCVPIIYGEQLHGILVVNFDKKQERFSNSTIEFTRSIASHAGIAMHQYNLIEQAKKSANREFLLRKITDNIRDDMDIDKTLRFICSEVAKLFNVQRAIIAEFIDGDETIECVLRNEYKISPDLQSLAVDSEANGYWSKKILNTTNLLAFDNISESFTPDYFKDEYESIGVKSAICASIEKNDQKWGMMILFDYENQRHWSEEEINLLKTITNQIYISISQANLYFKTKIQAQQVEAFLSTLQN